MNLIRNGGFERGDLSYWGIETAGSLAYDTTTPLRGVGAGELTASGLGQETIINQDYVKVSPYNTYMLSAYINSAAVRWCRLYAVEYDQNLNVIAVYNIAGGLTTGAYKLYQSLHVTKKESAYLRLRVAVDAALVGETFYIDGVGVAPAKVQDMCIDTVHLANRVVANVSDDTGDNRQDLQAFNTFIADICVYAVAGVNPTLDVGVYEESAQWQPVLVGTFAQLIATGSERIVLSNVTGKSLYAVYVIGGTTPEFDFSVGVTGKR